MTKLLDRAAAVGSREVGQGWRWIWVPAFALGVVIMVATLAFWLVKLPFALLKRVQGGRAEARRIKKWAGWRRGG